MRQITKQSIAAFLSDFTFSKQNMVVKVYSEKTELFLHGNIIAIKDRYTNKISITNAGWQSNTTKERLNALPNVHIQQKNFVWYLNGKVWNGNLIDINK